MNCLVVLLVLLVSPGCVKLAWAQDCSENCEAAFIGACWPTQCNNLGTAEEAYEQCVIELRAGSGPIAIQCSASDCTLTGPMNAMATGMCEGGNGGGGGTTAMCDNEVTGTPATPTLCTADDASPLVYTFYPMTGQHSGTSRYFSVLNLPTAVPPGGPQPVMIMVNGYGGDSKLSRNQLTTAQRYGITLLQITSSLDDQAGGFSLEFGNDGVANDANPTPCSAEDTRDLAYLANVFAWIEARSHVLDTARVYTRGFSQNSMFAAYTAICFADKVAGVWQGGSGLALTGHTPIVPGAQAQCALSDALADGGTEECCSSSFCETCKYWPAYPQTCAVTQPDRQLTDCLMMYTDDSICGSDYYMFKAMAREGNDARLLSFPGSNPETGQGHTDPENAWSWVAGCLGLSEACSSECEATFVSTCMSNSISHTGFASCETSLHAGSLAGCTPGCSPTLVMLMTSETPVVSLSEGKFGTSSGLGVTGADDAPRPACTSAFGTFAAAPPNNCNPPELAVMPDSAVYPDTCGGGGSGGVSSGVVFFTTYFDDECTNAASDPIQMTVDSACNLAPDVSMSNLQCFEDRISWTNWPNTGTGAGYTEDTGCVDATGQNFPDGIPNELVVGVCTEFPGPNTVWKKVDADTYDCFVDGGMGTDIPSCPLGASTIPMVFLAAAGLVIDVDDACI